MKGNELIEKILNKEIKSGTLIKMKSHYPGLEWEKTICFNGNWFSEEEYYPGVSRYNDIILHLCSEHMTFEIIEDKKIEKLETYDIAGNIFLEDCCFKYIPIDKEKLTANEQVFVNKIDEIIDYINGGTNGK